MSLCFVCAVQGDGKPHALDALMPVPFQRLHHAWCRDKTEVPAHWSCMSGLTMCLNGRNDQGPCTVPFTMTMKRKDNVGREPVVVAVLEERTMEYVSTFKQ